ncbi:MAG: hypothetical protein Q7T10_12010, partial [Rhodoferax sp.]|nr:hypothetical protein [Rhodoferax sp.]
IHTGCIGERCRATGIHRKTVAEESGLMHCLAASVQLDAGGKDFIESLDPDSLKVVTGFVEPSLASAQADDKFQFERHGYFVADRADHTAGRRVFNYAVGLKDSWGKQKLHKLLITVISGSRK